MDPFLTILPEKGYINTTFVFKPNGVTSKFKIIVSLGNKKISENQDLEATMLIYQVLKEPGLYNVLVQTDDGVILTGSVEVANSIQLGSGVLDFVHADENGSIVLLVKSDRTVVYNHEKQYRFEILGISPSRVVELNENFLLFETLIDDQLNCYNYGFFNKTTLRVESEIEQARLIHHDTKFHTIVFYELIKDRLAFIDVSLDYYFDYDQMAVFYQGRCAGISEIHHFLINVDVDAVRIINSIGSEVRHQFSKKDNILIDAGSEVILKMKQGKMFASSFTLAGFHEVELDKNYVLDISSTYKHNDFLLSNWTAPDKQEESRKLREAAFTKVWDENIQMGGEFEVVIEKAQVFSVTTYLFHNLLSNISIHKTLTSTSWNKAFCRKSKYHRTQEDILWEFKPMQDKSETTSNIFLRKFFGPGAEFDGLENVSYNFAKDRNTVVLYSKALEKSYVFSKLDSIYPIQGDTSLAKVFILGENVYVLSMKDGQHDLIKVSGKGIGIQLSFSGNLQQADYLESFGLLWFRSAAPPAKASGKDGLYIYDIFRNVYLPIAKQIPHSLPIELEDGKMEYHTYSLARNGRAGKDHYQCEYEVLVSLDPFEIKAAVAGKVLGYSGKLNKVITFRDDDGYYLYLYDQKENIYIAQKIEGLGINYSKSELVPNGKSVLLKTSNSSKLEIYDIERNEVVSFFNGKFLSFSNEGNIVIEENMTRNIRVFDPNTFQDITPAQYHHYRFLSPDGKLYSQLSGSSGYYHFLENRELTESEFNIINDEFAIAKEEKESDYERRIKALLAAYQIKYVREINDESFKLSGRIAIAGKVTFIEIGICGTDVVEKVPSKTLSYYNCLSFSYDNAYVGLVGKPFGDGMFQLFKIEFDPSNNSLKLVDRMVYDEPNKATWVCSFSRNGYFGTFDSNPNSFMLKVTDELFERKNQSYKMSDFKEVEKKSFECFSNNGRFAALSEKSYSPMSLGGRGHIASKELHLYDLEEGKIVVSYPEHGDFVSFAAFSEDDSKLLSRSSDGVIIIRNIALG